MHAMSEIRKNSSGAQEVCVCVCPLRTRARSASIATGSEAMFSATRFGPGGLAIPSHVMGTSVAHDISLPEASRRRPPRSSEPRATAACEGRGQGPPHRPGATPSRWTAPQRGRHLRETADGAVAPARQSPPQPRLAPDFGTPGGAASLGPERTGPPKWPALDNLNDWTEQMRPWVNWSQNDRGRDPVAT